MLDCLANINNLGHSWSDMRKQTTNSNNGYANDHCVETLPEVDKEAPRRHKRTSSCDASNTNVGTRTSYREMPA